MFKRIGLFLATNLAILLVISAILFLVEKFFGININATGTNYTGLLIFAALWGFIGSFISLFMSKWMAKRAYNIEVIGKDDLYNLSPKEKLVWEIVEEISDKHKIKMPEVGIYEDIEPNAFATGPSKNNSLVAVSSGLLENMNSNEIKGVIGHEMAHILNGDMVTMTLLQGVLNTFVIFFARILASIAEGFLSKNEESEGNSWIYFGLSMLFELILGIFASMIAMWFSRIREYKADAGSARFLGKENMIEALMALKKMEPVLVHSEDGKDNLAAFKIEAKKGRGLASLFASHPSLDDRIKALENLRV